MQGSDLLEELPRSKFVEAFSPAAGDDYRQVKVDLDGAYGGEVFEAFARDERWNGCLMPFFAFETAKAIQEMTPGVEYVAADDAFVVQFSSDEEPDVYPATNITVEGSVQKVYGLGRGSWCWVEAQTPDSRAQAESNTGQAPKTLRP